MYTGDVNEDPPLMTTFAAGFPRTTTLPPFVDVKTDDETHRIVTAADDPNAMLSFAVAITPDETLIRLVPVKAPQTVSPAPLDVMVADVTLSTRSDIAPRKAIESAADDVRVDDESIIVTAVASPWNRALFLTALIDDPETTIVVEADV